MAVEPLLGRPLAVMLPSPAYNGATVDLWIYPLDDGRVRVDSTLPIDAHRVLFRATFEDTLEAIDYWRAQYRGLFDVDPLE